VRSQTVLAEVLSDGDVVEATHCLQLEAEPRAAREARRFTRSVAPELPQDTVDTMVLLTSELVTNALVHARTSMEVGVIVAARSVVVTVYDLDLAGSSFDLHPAREGGWGLALVDALSESWSAVLHPGGGKTMWFRLLRTPAPAVTDGAAARTDSGQRDS